MTNAQSPVPPPPPESVPPTSVSPAPAEAAAGITKDERTWAMIAHLAALAGFVIPAGNVVGPLVVFLVKKDQSPYVAFHAKQSMWFQIFAFATAAILGIAGFLLCFTIPLAAVVWGGAMVYAIYGGIQVSSGKNFEYYWVGAWVRRTM